MIKNTRKFIKMKIILNEINLMHREERDKKKISAVSCCRANRPKITKK